MEKNGSKTTSGFFCFFFSPPLVKVNLRLMGEGGLELLTFYILGS